MLMMVGMAVVFAFLTILIFATKALTRFSLAFPEPESTKPTPISPAIVKPDEPSQQVVAAISAAVNQYRNKNK